MQTQEKYNLITNQLAEVIGQDEILNILEQRDLKIYWGTATTGKPHFGYFVPIFKISDFLRAGCSVTILFADLHGFLDDNKTNWNLIEKRCEWYEKIIRQMLSLVGVPLENLKFVRGTSFQLSSAYTLDMYKLTALCNTKQAIHAGAEVVKASKTPLMSSLLYPMLQALDEEYLKVDVQFGGVDQRKIFMFAREYLPKLGYEKRCHMMNPLIPSLTKSKGKMSASDGRGKIDFDDSEEEVTNKIQAAFSVDSVVEGNGLLAILKYVIFRWLENKGEKLKVDRPEEFGGRVEFSSYDELEEAFANKTLGSCDLKVGLAEVLNRFIEPLREFCNQNKSLIDKAYPK